MRILPASFRSKHREMPDAAHIGARWFSQIADSQPAAGI